MEFGINKCAMLVMKRGKVCRSDGIELPGEQTIKGLEDGEGYKYLGILEADDVKNKEMKDLVTKEYYRRIRNILRSKLNGGNVIKAINSRAVAIIRYGAGLIKWTKDELRTIDRKTRKLMTIHKALHPRSDVDRLYLSRKEGGRGLISVEDCVDIEVQNLSDYISQSSEEMLLAVKEENTVGNGLTKEETREKHKQSYMSKALHYQFQKGTEDNRAEISWNWLRKGTLKKETEGMLLAAQDQALRTNSIKHRIDKQDISPMCRMCKGREETIAHIVSECPKLAQNQYKNWRHDNVAKVIHWVLCQRYEFQSGDKWYEHNPEKVIENENVNLLWDFRIQTDHVLEHNRPDIVILLKKERECYLIDVACPFDTRVAQKEGEKKENYADLKREISTIWKCRKVIVVPVVIGALGTMGKDFLQWVQKIGMEEHVYLMQKACLLGTARITRKVLES